MTTRLTVAISCFVTATLLEGCVVSDITRYCSFTASPSLRDADSETLGVVLGWPGAARIEDPYMSLYSPSIEQQETALKVPLVAAAVPWPSDLDESRCRDLDWRTYKVAIDSEQWRAFWNRPGFVEFEGGLGYTDHSAKPGTSFLPLRSFAMAWVDTATGKPIMSCGCYQS